MLMHMFNDGNPELAKTTYPWVVKKRKGVPKLRWERGCELSTNVIEKGAHHSLHGPNPQKENGVSFGKVLRWEWIT